MKESGTAGSSGVYQYDGRVSVGVAIPFGLQHVLAMLVSNITPVILVAGVCGIEGTAQAKLIQSALLIAGIGTLIQLFPIWRIGARLPVVTGLSFSFVGVFCYIGATSGYETILGAVLVGGLIEGVLGLLATYWMRIIQPIVSATVVLAIGFSLLPVGAQSFGGAMVGTEFGAWQSWLVGGTTLVVCLILHAFGKGMVKTLSALIGLVVGYLLALCLGLVDFSSVSEASIVGLPGFLAYGFEFQPGAILSVLCIYLVSMTEVMGNCSAVASSGLGREATRREISGGIVGTGFISALSSVFGCLPYTVYGQNVGLVAMTGVVNRIALALGAGIIVLAGFSPILGAVLTTVPTPVLGGCTIMLFGTIVVSGIEMVARAGFSSRNVTILSLSLAVGLGFTQVPGLFDIFPEIIRSIFAENCVAIVFILALLLSLILPKEEGKE